MTHELRVQPFSASLLTDVQDFHCGDAPWDVEVAQWIKEPTSGDCAVKWLERGTQVWLYKTDDGKVVGYGSLGTTKWKWPPPDGPREDVSIIPFLGVDCSFQGQPDAVPREERYAYQIIGDLIYKASLHSAIILGLFVHLQNGKAINFYDRVGFQRLPDQDDGYIKMFLELPSLASL